MHSEKQLELLNLWLILSEHAGWWHPYENVVVACEPPEIQKIDEEGRLHNEDGPAILCRDGWAVYAWHGVRLRPEIIEEKNKLEPSEILKEENAEVRRAMMNLYGVERLLKHAELEQQDNYGELYKFNLPDGPEKFVLVVNGTPEPDGTFKEYILPTWPEVQSAHEAVARSYGLETKNYAPELRT